MSLINVCTQHLVAISKALQAYEKEHGDFPKWLSELHPKYLADADALICPADEESGIPILPYDQDPNLPMSYDYHFDPEYREWTNKERRVYGDANPIVRCLHHANPDTDSTLFPNFCLHLSYSYTVYQSDTAWQEHPVEMYGSLEAAINGYERALQLVPEDPDFFRLYPGLVRLYVEAKRDKDAENLIDSFRTIMKPDENLNRFRDYWILVNMLKQFSRHEDALQLLQKLEKSEQENPLIRGIFREIAKIHEEQGNTDLAEVYNLKANPKLALIGKSIEDFTATDLDGNPISLQDYRGKVVLLDFWAVWCGPCIAEMPNVKKVYDAYKDDGFDVIGISLDDDETELREYLKVCDIPWRQIFSGKSWDSPIAKQYGIRGIPSPWLIDTEGKLISFQARGAELKRLVAKAVKSGLTD